MFFESIPKIIDKIKTLEKEEKYALLFQLLETEIIDFNDFNAAYVNVLSDNKKNQERLLSKCFLNLGYLSINQNAPLAKETRKFLFDQKVWSIQDGSEFGKILNDEFNP